MAMVEVVVAMASTLETDILVIAFLSVSIWKKKPKMFSVVCSPESCHEGIGGAYNLLKAPAPYLAIETPDGQSRNWESSREDQVFLGPCSYR